MFEISFQERTTFSLDLFEELTLIWVLQGLEMWPGGKSWLLINSFLDVAIRKTSIVRSWACSTIPLPGPWSSKFHYSFTLLWMHICLLSTWLCQGSIRGTTVFSGANFYSCKWSKALSESPDHIFFLKVPPFWASVDENSRKGSHHMDRKSTNLALKELLMTHVPYDPHISLKTAICPVRIQTHQGQVVAKHTTLVTVAIS